MKSQLRWVVTMSCGPMLLSLVASSAFGAGNPERDAYFGEEHIHTSWSVDAWVMGNRITGPDDAYKYAQGQTIKHPMGYDIKIDTPMDFMGVTDHSEYVGVTKQANTPGSLREQAARGAAADHEGSQQRGRAAEGLPVPAHAS